MKFEFLNDHEVDTIISIQFESKHQGSGILFIIFSDDLGNCCSAWGTLVILMLAPSP